MKPLYLIIVVSILYLAWTIYYFVQTSRYYCEVDKDFNAFKEALKANDKETMKAIESRRKDDSFFNRCAQRHRERYAWLKQEGKEIE
jgi:hypothetical protein